MSGLKHCVKRRVHLERATPSSKVHKGPMERKDSFKERMERVHERQKLVKILSHKARDRNPDEFRFGMKSSKMVNGKLKKLSADQPAPKSTGQKPKAKKKGPAKRK